MGIIGAICLLIALGMGLWILIRRNKNTLRLVPGIENPKVAVLIPARDESAVISGVLESLRKQTYALEMSDVYVIVESTQDPTVEICQQYGAEVILRREPELQRKGYALNEAVKEILAKKHYDAYFIFDADNTMENDFIEKILRRYIEGYQVVTGYRQMKNRSPSALEIVSSLTFAMINGIGNRQRLREQGNMTFSGTGFCIDGRLVDEWGEWPFHSLTEDYELSLYATLHGLATYYDEGAVFYDEQPAKYSQTVAQRVRWIRGYFDTRKEYVPLLRKVKANQCNNYGSIVKARTGVKPIILLIIGLVLIALDLIMWLIVKGWGWNVLWLIAGFLGFIYVVLAILTVVLVISEKMKLSKKMWLKVVLLNPLYLITYIPCALKALLKREVTWTKIQHGES